MNWLDFVQGILMAIGFYQFAKFIVNIATIGVTGYWNKINKPL